MQAWPHCEIHGWEIDEAVIEVSEVGGTDKGWRERGGRQDGWRGKVLVTCLTFLRGWETPYR